MHCPTIKRVSPEGGGHKEASTEGASETSHVPSSVHNESPPTPTVAVEEDNQDNNREVPYDGDLSNEPSSTLLNSSLRCLTRI